MNDVVLVKRFDIVIVEFRARTQMWRVLKALKVW